MVGDLVGEVDVVVWVFDDDLAHGLVAAAVGGESVQAASREQHGPLHAQRALVAKHAFVVSAAVIGVLMQVDDFLFGLAAKRLAGHGGGCGCSGGCG